MTTDFAREGFRAAPTLNERVFEAAKLFGAANNGNLNATAKVQEALSTSDFPLLLAKGFEVEAIKAQKDAVREFDAILYPTTHKDFRPKKLYDLFGSGYFEDVAEGEEYKGGNLDETEVQVSLGKTGRTYGLTWELRVNGDFTDLAKFPKRLGNDATNTENRKTAQLLTAGGKWDAGFFGTVDTRQLTAQNLQDVLQEQAVKEDWRGDLIDTTRYALVFSPGLRAQVNYILNATELELNFTDGTKVTKIKQGNPFKGIVTPVESLSLGREFDTATRGKGWALIPLKDATLPGLVLSSLAGHPDVDIRVQRDQGESIGGGAIGIEDGSFKDDTIHFRGRKVIGVSKGFTDALYASNGS